MNKIVTLIFFFILTLEAYGACSSPISRTNNSANAVLTSSKYNTDLNTVYNKVNDLDGDCITDASIPTAKYENGSVTVAKLATGYKDDAVLAKTSTYTVLSTDEFITGDATSGSITFNLPTAVGITGRKIKFKKIDSSANTLILDGSGSQTIDGATTLTITNQYDSVEIVSNGSNWLRLSNIAFTDYVSSTGSVAPKMCSFRIAGASRTTACAGSSSCTVYESTGSCTSSVATDSNTYQINWTTSPAYWTQIPKCTYSAWSTSSSTVKSCTHTAATTDSTSAKHIKCGNDGTAGNEVNLIIDVVCFGK